MAERVIEKELGFTSKIFDTDDVTYDYFGYARRQDVNAAEDRGDDPETLPIWYIVRNTKVSPFKTRRTDLVYGFTWTGRAGHKYV